MKVLVYFLTKIHIFHRISPDATYPLTWINYCGDPKKHWVFVGFALSKRKIHCLPSSVYHFFSSKTVVFRYETDILATQDRLSDTARLTILRSKIDYLTFRNASFASLSRTTLRLVLVTACHTDYYTNRQNTAAEMPAPCRTRKYRVDFS